MSATFTNFDEILNWRQKIISEFHNDKSNSMPAINQPNPNQKIFSAFIVDWQLRADEENPAQLKIILPDYGF